jgi:CMP-N,N'-diacetyllegionaminic acid synthase
MKTVGIIPARSGSKGISYKNKRMMSGQPLIAWTIQAAQMANSIDHILVTTDDEDIAKIARDLGVAVPFMRPPELAQDNTPGIEPILHALSTVQGFDTVVVLQPTSPLRTPGDIDAAAQLAQTWVSVVSVCETREPIQWTYTIEDGGALKALWPGEMAARRQDVMSTYTLNGSIYYCDIPWLISGGQLMDEATVPYVMPPERSIDIDSHFDWEVAEFLLSRSV